MKTVHTSGACTVWALTGGCCPEQNAGRAACLGATSSGQGDLQMAETPQGKCSLSPEQGGLPWLVCPGHDPADGRVCLRAAVGFAELRPGPGSGSWGLFPEALPSAVVFYLFIPVPLEGGCGPQCCKVWEEGR